MNLNIFVPGLESYMEDINITNNVNTESEETPAEEVKEESTAEAIQEAPKTEEAQEEAPKAEEAPAETAEEIEDQKEELFVSFWK